MDELPTEETHLDAAILSALGPAANRMQEAYGEEVTEVIVTKAVVCFEYIDAHGSADWAYRRVKASWFDVGGSAAMLTAALGVSWDDENDADD